MLAVVAERRDCKYAICLQGFDQEVARSRPNKKTRKYEGINKRCFDK